MAVDDGRRQFFIETGISMEKGRWTRFSRTADKGRTKNSIPHLLIPVLYSAKI